MINLIFGNKINLTLPPNDLEPLYVPNGACLFKNLTHSLNLTAPLSTLLNNKIKPLLLLPQPLLTAPAGLHLLNPHHRVPPGLRLQPIYHVIIAPVATTQIIPSNNAKHYPKLIIMALFVEIIIYLEDRPPYLNLNLTSTPPLTVMTTATITAIPAAPIDAMTIVLSAVTHAAPILVNNLETINPVVSAALHHVATIDVTPPLPKRQHHHTQQQRHRWYQRMLLHHRTNAFVANSSCRIASTSP